mmetsp:Transcript_23932/g.57727  ORF Transcript_23932/g.57727 Transcript_23932/m.57727 type:complete len:408 (+) Transcript_23932:165-1388(+)
MMPMTLLSMALLVLLCCHRGDFECDALLPSSSYYTKATRRKHVIRSRGSFAGRSIDRPKIDIDIRRASSPDDDDLNDSYDDDAWTDQASRAILSGQDEFFFGPGVLRGGDGANGGNDFSARYPSMFKLNEAMKSIKEGYERRIAADPSFLSKSLLEIVLAASTQYMAEVGRRGKGRILPEIDFVFAGILTAVCGKYYSMWRVARTVDVDATVMSDGGAEGENAVDTKNDDAATTTTNNWRDRIPTNAFQPTLLDGRTAPSLSARCLAFVLPMPQLFRAGVVASTIGYGLTWFLIWARTSMVPGYVAATRPVSVPLAAIYTGSFMAIVSNVRYQLLQGVVEPYLIDGFFGRIEAMGNAKGASRKLFGRIEHLRHMKKLTIVMVRWANGLLGSWIAIGGMRAFGLQKLK